MNSFFNIELIHLHKHTQHTFVINIISLFWFVFLVIFSCSSCWWWWWWWYNRFYAIVQPLDYPLIMTYTKVSKFDKLIFNVDTDFFFSLLLGIMKFYTCFGMCHKDVVWVRERKKKIDKWIKFFVVAFLFFFTFYSRYLWCCVLYGSRLLFYHFFQYSWDGIRQQQI